MILFQSFQIDSSDCPNVYDSNTQMTFYTTFLLKFIPCLILVFFLNLQIFQAYNQHFFRAWEFSCNLGTSISNHLQHKKESPYRVKPLFFPSGNS